MFIILPSFPQGKQLLEPISNIMLQTRVMVLPNGTDPAPSEANTNLGRDSTEAAVKRVFDIPEINTKAKPVVECTICLLLI